MTSVLSVPHFAKMRLAFDDYYYLEQAFYDAACGLDLTDLGAQ